MFSRVLASQHHGPSPFSLSLRQLCPSAHGPEQLLFLAPSKLGSSPGPGLPAMFTAPRVPVHKGNALGCLRTQPRRESSCLPALSGQLVLTQSTLSEGVLPRSP